jgi:DNA-binding cell septation regulator SpoVG
MTIERMKKGNWGNILAFFDLKTEDGFLITGMKIVNGVNGKFVGFPSKAEEGGKYSEIVRAERDVRDNVAKLAIEHYDSQADEAFDDIPGAYDTEKTPEVAEKANEELPF